MKKDALDASFCPLGGKRCLPELPPGFFFLLYALLGVGAIAALQHALGVVTQLSHAQGVIGFDEDHHGFAHRRHVLVVLDGSLRTGNGRHIGASAVVVLGDMDFVLGQRVHDVLHALAGIIGVLGIWKAGHQFAEGLERILGGFLVAFG